MSAAAILSFAIPTTLILVGLIGGFWVERRLVNWLQAIANRTPWDGYTILLRALTGIITLGFVLAGVYAATLTLNLTPRLFDLSQKLLLALMLGATTLVVTRLAVGFVELYSRRSEAALPLTSLFENLTRLLIFLLGILIILQSVGISITPLLTALGVGGISIGLALQNTLANLFSGLSIIMSRKVRPGDYIQMGTGEAGYVSDITWRATTIQEIENNLIVVPNSKLLASNFKNYNLPDKETLFVVELGVSYESDLEKVEQVTLEVAQEVLKEVDGGIKEFQPFINYYDFADFRINFRVFLKVQEFIDQRHIRHAFIKQLHRRYRAEEIQIPFPIRMIYSQDSIQ